MTNELPDEEEWTTTPLGNCSIEVDIDTDTVERLMNIWVRENLDPASVEKFNDEYAVNGDQVEALHDAVFNDIIIAAIKTQIDRMLPENDDAEIDSI